MVDDDILIRYTGDRRCQDNVVRYHWENGDQHRIPEEDARLLLTNGNFIETTEENDDDECDLKSRHMIFSNDNEPCPECGVDKWVDDEDTEDGHSLDKPSVPLTEDDE